MKDYGIHDVKQSFRDLLDIIEIAYQSDDPHGALDQIAEHAVGARDTLNEHERLEKLHETR